VFELPADSRPARVPPPAGDGWERVRRADRAVTAARGALSLSRDSLERERARLEDERRYLASGLGDVRRESVTLAHRSHLLDSLQASMDPTAMRLMELRDAASLHFQRRAAAVLARCEAQERWIRAMDHLYLQGPDRERQAATPPALKGPDVVLAQEGELAQSLRFSVRRMLRTRHGASPPRTSRRGGPRLMDRAGALAPGARVQLVRARALGSALDSSLASARTSPELERLAARTASLERESARRDAVASALRAEVAHEAVTAALAALELEREPLDYGLAASAWARAVRLSAADTLPVAARAIRSPDSDDPYAPAADSVASRDRAEAIARASVFLADHPDSPARGEMRFRLADLLVTQAQADFRERMNAWLAAQSQGRRAPLPVVDHAQAVELYRRILAEDGSLPHRDAVLYNAGLLLADGGDPEAAVFFRRLLAEYPASAYVQESSLRLGDLAFDAGRMDEGVSHYTRAARGSDPHAHRDRALQDRAGRTTTRAGSRPPRRRSAACWTSTPARRVHACRPTSSTKPSSTWSTRSPPRAVRRSSSACSPRAATASGRAAQRAALRASRPARDGAALPPLRRAQGCRRRRPALPVALASDPAVLDVVGRLADSQHRAERPAEERATRLAWAERFAPGGEWAKAQTSDSLRRAGEQFAHSAWQGEALEHHRLARTGGSEKSGRKRFTTTSGSSRAGRTTPRGPRSSCMPVRRVPSWSSSRRDRALSPGRGTGPRQRGRASGVAGGGRHRPLVREHAPRGRRVVRRPADRAAIRSRAPS
jgi:TolA-binding protein